MPLSIRNLSATAWRRSGMPELGVYLVKPASSADIAAALMCSGVSKSGSPAPKLQTSIPSDFIALALLSIERVRDGVKLVALEESCIGTIATTICASLSFQPMNSKEDNGWVQSRPLRDRLFTCLSSVRALSPI